MRLAARHYRTEVPILVECHEGRIAAIREVTLPSAEPALTAEYIAPALFDLQINGCQGKAFNSPHLTRADVRQIVTECQSHGIAGLCPTLITGSYEALLHGFTTLTQAAIADPEIDRAIPCYHLEGPYISPEDGPRGAHPLAHVRPPSFDEFRRWQFAAQGRIRLVTLAPEHENALDFIRRLTDLGVVVAIGHTAASPERIRAAISAGAKLSTHLGNGSHATLPRHHNYLWEQLAADDLVASFIPDGHHLPSSLVRALVRTKTAKRLIVTCDASSLAGLPPGRYTAWGQELEVQAGGKVVVPGTTFLAGSGVFTDDCLRWLVRQGDVSLPDALEMAGQRPRHLLRLPTAELCVGQPADFLLYDRHPAEIFTLRQVIVGGRQVSSIAG